MTAALAHPGEAEDEFFAKQPSGRADLPDPEPLLINLAHSVIEVYAGVRDLAQLSRWINEDVYRSLLKRASLAARARAVKKTAAVRPALTLGSVSVSEPRDGVVEAVVVVHSKARTRAVAIRLEGMDHRWRASAISVL